MMKQISIPCSQKTGQESKHTICQEQIGRSIIYRHGKNINLVNNEKKQLEIYHYNTNWCSVYFFWLQSLELFIILQSPSHLCSSLASFLLYVYVFSTMVLLCFGDGVVFGSKDSETLY